MLEEFFILKETNLFYYYSKDEAEIDFNRVILDSGLLSALNSFTYSSRSNSINSFQTEKEIFKFTKIPDSSYDLVYVFNLEEFDEKRADLIIQNIFDLLSNSVFLTETKSFSDFNSQAYKNLTSSIRYILDFKIPQQLTDANLKEILEIEKSIDYCIVKENSTSKTIARYSKRASFLTSSFEEEQDLIISVIKTSLHNLDLAELFLVCTFEGGNQQFLIFNMGEYVILILSSEIKSNSFYTEFLKNFTISKNLFQYAKYSLADFRVNSKYIRESNGKIVFKEGVQLFQRVPIYLGTLTQNIMNFTKIILPKGLKVFSIVYITAKNELSLLKSTLQEGQMEITINND